MILRSTKTRRCHYKTQVCRWFYTFGTWFISRNDRFPRVGHFICCISACDNDVGETNVTEIFSIYSQMSASQVSLRNMLSSDAWSRLSEMVSAGRTLILMSIFLSVDGLSSSCWCRCHSGRKYELSRVPEARSVLLDFALRRIVSRSRWRWCKTG